MLNQILFAIISLMFAAQHSAFAGGSDDLAQTLRTGSRLRFVNDQGIKNTTGIPTYKSELFYIFNGKVLVMKSTYFEGPQCWFMVIDDSDRNYSSSENMVVTAAYLNRRSAADQEDGESDEVIIYLAGAGPLALFCNRHDSNIKKPQPITYTEFLNTVKGVLEITPACEAVKGFSDLDLSKNVTAGSLTGTSLLFNKEIVLQTTPIIDLGIYTAATPTSSAIFQNGLNIGNSKLDPSKPQCTFMSMSNRSAIPAGSRLVFGRRDISQITPGHYAVLLSNDIWLSCDFSNADWGTKEVAETLGNSVSFQDVVCN